MADIVELKNTSAEEIAFKLYSDIIGVEDYPHRKMAKDQARAYLLNTYAECLNATRGLRRWQ